MSVKNKEAAGFNPTAVCIPIKVLDPLVSN